jgi:hypothetical protein
MQQVHGMHMEVPSISSQPGRQTWVNPISHPVLLNMLLELYIYMAVQATLSLNVSYIVAALLVISEQFGFIIFHPDILPH